MNPPFRPTFRADSTTVGTMPPITENQRWNGERSTHACGDALKTQQLCKCERGTHDGTHAGWVPLSRLWSVDYVPDTGRRVTASDEPPRVVRDVITHECLYKVVAVVVARLHPQFERLTGIGADG